MRDEHADARRELLRDPAMRLAELAVAAGSSWLVAEASELADQRPLTPRTIRGHFQRLRCLGARLGHHLHEQQRALDRGAAATLARANALRLVRAVPGPSEQPACARLATRLATERRKFLMSRTADALLALDARLAEAPCSRRELVGTAEQARDAIATGLAVELGRRAAADVERTVGEVARELLAELVSSLEDLGERVSPHAFAGFDMVTIGRPHQPYCGPTSRSSRGLAHFASRRRILTRARDELADALTTTSRHLIDAALADCEAACATLARRLGEHLDAALHSVLVGLQHAEAAHRAGPEHVVRRRQHLAAWSRDLEAILASL